MSCQIEVVFDNRYFSKAIILCNLYQDYLLHSEITKIAFNPKVIKSHIDKTLNPVRSSEVATIDHHDA